jgi:N-acetylglucosamine kinase-like BadF-type ATPase
MGISGCNTDADAVMFVGWVKELYSPSYCPIVHSYNDSIAALASGTAGHLHGLVVIAGTGQMAKGLNQRNLHHPTLPREWTCGGNGGLVDDGSGFGIALDTIRAAFQAADGMGPDTPILADVLAHVKGRTAEDIVPWMYNTFSWGHVATVAPIAFKWAAQDAVAMAIIRKHAAYLVRAAVTIVRKLGFDREEAVPVVLCGGILEHQLMAELVSAEVRKELPNAAITHPLVDPAHGAALLAITHYKEAQEKSS